MIPLARRIPQAASRNLTRRKPVDLSERRTALHTTHVMAEVAARIPLGTIDTHMHVIDPTKFPLNAAAKYQPSTHTLDQANAFLNRLGIERMVIVQPSIYGNDNSCTLGGLRRLGPGNGRAVVQFDPAVTSKEKLREWHELGVRGVRLNFKSVGVTPTRCEFEQTVLSYANAIRELKWPLEIYIAAESVPMLEDLVDGLGVNVIIDHYGHPSSETLSRAKVANEVPGFGSILKLLKGGHTWIKLSAGYRLSTDAQSPLLRSMCKELLRTRPDRCVFATDWPHTRYDSLEVKPFLEQVLDCMEEEGVDPKQVLVANAAKLFDYA